MSIGLRKILGTPLHKRNNKNAETTTPQVRFANPYDVSHLPSLLICRIPDSVNWHFPQSRTGTAAGVTATVTLTNAQPQEETNR